MVTAKNVAEFFLSLSSPELDDYISNLKLQKLLYYAQGFHIAIFEKPLFDDKIVAWEHGPVVESLYYEYKQNGSAAIPIPQEISTSMFSLEQIELLKEVYQIMGQFSAWKLRNMTHSESPWIDTPRNLEISHDKMKSYFISQID